MWKKTLCFICAFCCFICSINFVSAQENIVNLELDKTEIELGDKVEVNLSLNETISIRGIQFQVKYDVGRFAVEDTRKGYLFDDAMVASLNTSEAGVVKVVVAFDDEYEVDGELCNITLASREDAGKGDTAVKVEGIRVTDGSGEENEYDDIIGKISIPLDEPEPTPLPTQPPRPTATPKPEADDDAPATGEDDEAEDGEKEEKPTKKPSGGSSGGGSGSGKVPSVVPVPTPSSTPQPDEEKQCPFEDISEHWAADSIIELYNAGVINGKTDTLFAPEDNVTRAEFTKMILGILGDVEFEVKENIFSDVSENDWYYDYVVKGYSTGIINGYDEGFLPGKNITREEMAVISARCINFMKINISDIEKNDFIFGDADEFSEWSRDDIEMMAGINIINGIDGNFVPKSNATRAQAAVIIKRIQDLEKR